MRSVIDTKAMKEKDNLWRNASLKCSSLRGEINRVATATLERLEPCEGKLSRTVLMEVCGRKATHLPTKPFSMLRMTLDLLNKARTPEEVKKILKVATTDVQRAMASVDGLIQDVMGIGSKSEITPEPVQADTLVHTALADTFRIHNKADVELDISFNHELANVNYNRRFPRLSSFLPKFSFFFNGFRPRYFIPRLQTGIF